MKGVTVSAAGWFDNSVISTHGEKRSSDSLAFLI